MRDCPVSVRCLSQQWWWNVYGRFIADSKSQRLSCMGMCNRELEQWSLSWFCICSCTWLSSGRTVSIQTLFKYQCFAHARDDHRLYADRFDKTLHCALLERLWSWRWYGFVCRWTTSPWKISNIARKLFAVEWWQRKLYRCNWYDCAGFKKSRNGYRCFVDRY